MNEGRSLHPSKIDMSMMVKIAYDDHYKYGSSIIGQRFAMVKVEDTLMINVRNPELA